MMTLVMALLVGWVKDDASAQPKQEAPAAEHAASLVKRGNALYLKGEFEQALRDFDEAIRIDPTYAPAYQTRGMIHSVEKHWDKAFADYLQATLLDPGDVISMNNLANLMATCPVAKYRNGTRAVEYASRACVISGGTNPDLLDTLASAYAEAGNFPKAIEYQRKANRLFPVGDSRSNGKKKLELFQDQKPYREEPIDPRTR